MYHFLINAHRELVTEHSMRWQQLSLQIFQDFPLSCASVILICINRTSQNVALYGRPSFWTSAWLNRGGILPRTILVDPYDNVHLFSDYFISSDRYVHIYIYIYIYITGPYDPTITLLQDVFFLSQEWGSFYLFIFYPQ